MHTSIVFQVSLLALSFVRCSLCVCVLRTCEQAGVDGGGLSREWAVELIKLVVSSSSGLFQMEDNGMPESASAARSHDQLFLCDGGACVFLLRVGAQGAGP